jgi:hypothetical protein
MRKWFALLLLAPLLVGCGTFGQELQNIYTAATGASVPASAVLVAGNSFDAVEKTATNYIVFCSANRANPACANFVTIRGKLVPAVRSGRAARNNLEAFMIANPGALGPAGLYNTLQAAVQTLQDVMTKYHITGGAS